MKVGDWVHSYSMGTWRVWRVLSGFNEMRFSLDTPKSVSRCTLIFSSRLVNTSWKRSFSTECAELSLVRRISADDVGLGQIPGAGRERLREACSRLLGDPVKPGRTMDEVLVTPREAGYYARIGKTPINVTVQLGSVGHEARDREFILRYERVLEF